MWLYNSWFLFQPVLISFEDLPIKAEFPFNTETTIGYTVAYLFQIIAAFYALAHLTVMETIGFLSINQIALHINILTLKYSKLGVHRKKYGNDASFQKAMKTSLNALIIEHQDIIK